MIKIIALEHFMVAYYNETFDSDEKTLLESLSKFCSQETGEFVHKLKQDLTYFIDILPEENKELYDKLTFNFHRDISEKTIRKMIEFLNSGDNLLSP